MLRKAHWLRAVVLVFLAFGVGCSNGDRDVDYTGKVLFITDLHFDPFSNPSIFSQLDEGVVEGWNAIFSGIDQDLGSYGKGTTPWMFFSILKQLKAQAAGVDFVVFLGDVLAHDFNETYFNLAGTSDRDRMQAFTLKTYQFFYSALSEALPGKRIIFALGNNDYYCGDYQVEPDGPFLSDLSPLVASHLALSPVEQQEFNQSFRRGGYYSMQLPGRQEHQLLVLNAVLFSIDYTNGCGKEPDVDAGWEQLRWLRSELQNARELNQPVWMLLHIPLGLNIFSTIHGHLVNGEISQVEDFWREEFASEMQQLMMEYSDVVQASFSGHTHQDDFRVIGDTGILNKIIPSLSPVFDNNPGFIVLSFGGESLERLDYRTYYLDLLANQDASFDREQWRLEYDFSSTYQVGHMSVESLAALNRLIYDEEWVRRKFEDFYDVSNAENSPMSDGDRAQAYWCGQSQWSADDFLTCYYDR